MAEEIAQLVVALEARVNEFERNLERAKGTADREFKQIQSSSTRAAKAMDAEMARAAANVERTMSGLSGRIGELGRTAFAGFVGGLGAGAIMSTLNDLPNALKSVTAGFSEMKAEASRAGIPVEKFQALGYVARQSKIGLDALTDGLKEMNLRVDEFVTTGGGSAAESLKRLGYDASTLGLKLKDPVDLFGEIIDRLRQMDRAAQIRISDEIFGGTGGEQFVQLLGEGNRSIQEMMDEAKRLGLVIDSDLIDRGAELDKAFSRVADTISTSLKRSVVEVAGIVDQMIKNLAAAPGQAAGLDAFRGGVGVPGATSLMDRIQAQRQPANRIAELQTRLAEMPPGSHGAVRTEAEIRDLVNQMMRDQVPSATYSPIVPSFEAPRAADPFAGAAPSPTKKPNVLGLAPDADEAKRKADLEATAQAYQKVISATDQRIAMAEAEAKAVGMGDEAAAKYLRTLELWAALDAAHVKRTPEIVRAVEERAAALAKAEVAARQAEEAQRKSEDAAKKAAQEQQKAAKDSARFWSDSLGGALKSLSRGGDPKEILLNLGFGIGDKLIDEGMKQFQEKLAGNMKSSDGGILSAILGTSGSTSAPANAAQAALQNVATMSVTAGSVYLSGLAGLPGMNLGGTGAPAGAAGGAAGAGTSATSAAQVTPVARSALPPVTNPAPIPSLGQSITMGGGGGRFSVQKGENPNIDARLMDIIKTASERSGMTVKMTDGLAARKSSTSNHPFGMAADVSIMGPDGRWLNNYHNQRGETFRSYEQLAQEARRYQMEAYPELNDRFRWGGYFSGGKGKYGALDLMHFDLDRNRSGMGGGSWLNGLTPQQRALFPAAQSLGMANMPPAVAKAMGIPIPLTRPNIMPTAMPIDPASPAALAANPNVNAIDLGGMFGGALAALLGGKGGAGALIGAIASPLLSALFGKIGFAEGGVSDKPAIFGERGAEAAVPLSRGRYIPVEMRTRSSDERPKSRILNYYAGETNFNFNGPISGSEENRKALLAEMDRKMRENNERWAEKLADERANEWRRG